MVGPKRPVTPRSASVEAAINAPHSKDPYWLSPPEENIAGTRCSRTAAADRVVHAPRRSAVDEDRARAAREAARMWGRGADVAGVGGVGIALSHRADAVDEDIARSPDGRGRRKVTTMAGAGVTKAGCGRHTVFFLFEGWSGCDSRPRSKSQERGSCLAHSGRRQRPFCVQKCRHSGRSMRHNCRV
ncbi:hypothetical protein SAMN05877809_11258 [Rhodobacter sp. JA431]|nr:hypothetical protein SAMN05877809_11258 [Rhodobacter sp. JA431]